MPLDSSSPWIVTKINSWMKTVAKVGPTLEGTAGDQWRELRALMCLETEASARARARVCVCMCVCVDLLGLPRHLRVVPGQYLSSTLTWDVRLQVEWLANTLYPHLTRVCDTGSDVGPMDIVFCHNDLQEGNWIVKPDGSFKVRDRLLKDQPLVCRRVSCARQCRGYLSNNNELHRGRLSTMSTVDTTSVVRCRW